MRRLTGWWRVRYVGPSIAIGAIRLAFSARREISQAAGKAER